MANKQMHHLKVGDNIFEIVDSVARSGISGAPTIVSLSSAMSDTSKLYLYIGSETGYTSGDWYYHNGTSWVSGGQYGDMQLDTSLTTSGMAADAKATGDRLKVLEEATIETDDTLTIEGAAADAKAAGDAIKEASIIGVRTVISPQGSIDGLINQSGTVISSTATKSFYARCRPNTTYKLVVLQGAQPAKGQAHFIASFPGVPSIGSVASLKAYTAEIPPVVTEFTTGANDTYLLYGHGTWLTDNNLQIIYEAEGTISVKEKVLNLEVSVEGKLSKDGSDELTNEQKAAIRASINAEEAGNGISDETKNAIINCFRSVAWASSNGDGLIAELEELFFPGSSAELPAKYQRVEYIEATGTQMIQTDVIPGTTDFSVEIKFLKNRQATSSEALVAGFLAGQSYQRFSLSFRTGSNVFGIYSSDWKEVEVPNLYGNTVIETVNFRSSSPYADGTVAVGGQSVTFQKTKQNFRDIGNGVIAFFNIGKNGGAPASARIMECRFYYGDDTIAKFIPCYRKSDGVIGMFDSVSRTFFTNSGTGTFLKGGDINDL